MVSWTGASIPSRTPIVWPFLNACSATTFSCALKNYSMLYARLHNADEHTITFDICADAYFCPFSSSGRITTFARQT